MDSKNKKIMYSLPPEDGAESKMQVEEDDTSPGPALNQTQPSNETGYLNEVSEIVVKQLFNIQGATRGLGEPNSYTIFDKISGEKLYRVHETESVCAQPCFGGCRPFKISIYDNLDRELILIEKTLASCNCFCGLFSCYDRVNAYVRNFKSIQFEWRSVGSVRQYWCPLFPYFRICDNYGLVQFVVRGPLCTSGLYRPVIFPIKSSTGDVVGEIRKQWNGLCREYTSDVDVFQMQFPPGADEKMKVSLIAALFMIDFKYYESGCKFCRLSKAC